MSEGVGSEPLALSTMWAQQERFRGDFHSFVEIARDAGFRGIEISHSTDTAGLEECLRSQVLPVVSLHAPAPYSRSETGRSNSALNLASTDDAERQAAVAATQLTLDYAARAGIGRVVVHLGSIDGGPRDEEGRLRALYAEGAIDGDESATVRDRAFAVRVADGARHREPARRSLSAIVAAAATHGITVGLETRLHFFEIPSPDEALSLLAEYSPEEAGYWHDTGHAEVWSRLGLVPHRRWFDLLGDRLVGAHLHDVRDLRDHHAPGNGTLDWSMIREGVPASVARTCEIDQHEPIESLAAAVALLEAVGLR